MEIRKMRGVSQEALIFRLNPKIILGAITSNHMYRKRDLPDLSIEGTPKSHRRELTGLDGTD